MIVLAEANYNGDNGNNDAIGINANDNAHINNNYNNNNNNDIGSISTIWYNICTAFLSFHNLNAKNVNMQYMALLYSWAKSDLGRNKTRFFSAGNGWKFLHSN